MQLFVCKVFRQSSFCNITFLFLCIRIMTIDYAFQCSGIFHSMSMERSFHGDAAPMLPQPHPRTFTSFQEFHERHKDEEQEHFGSDEATVRSLVEFLLPENGNIYKIC